MQWQWVHNYLLFFLPYSSYILLRLSKINQKHSFLCILYLKKIFVKNLKMIVSRVLLSFLEKIHGLFPRYSLLKINFRNTRKRNHLHSKKFLFWIGALIIFINFKSGIMSFISISLCLKKANHHMVYHGFQSLVVYLKNLCSYLLLIVFFAKINSLFI